MSIEAYPIDVDFPDISAHEQSACGIAYVHTFDSGVPGPHVMINALTHGNEVCGAIVVDELLCRALRPRRGRLTLAFANVAGYQRFDINAAVTLHPRVRWYVALANAFDKDYQTATGFVALPRTVRTGVTLTLGGDR